MAMVHDALVFHCHDLTTRPDIMTRTYMSINNFAFFVRKHNPHSTWAKLGFVARTLRGLVSGVFEDILNTNFTFPQFRGVFWALRSATTILHQDPELLPSWYREFQRKVYEKSGGLTGSARTQDAEAPQRPSADA